MKANHVWIVGLIIIFSFMSSCSSSVEITEIASDSGSKTVEATEGIKASDDASEPTESAPSETVKLISSDIEQHFNVSPDDAANPFEVVLDNVWISEDSLISADNLNILGVEPDIEGSLQTTDGKLIFKKAKLTLQISNLNEPGHLSYGHVEAYFVAGTIHWSMGLGADMDPNIITAVESAGFSASGLASVQVGSAAASDVNLLAAADVANVGSVLTQNASVITTRIAEMQSAGDSSDVIQDVLGIASGATRDPAMQIVIPPLTLSAAVDQHNSAGGSQGVTFSQLRASASSVAQFVQVNLGSGRSVIVNGNNGGSVDLLLLNPSPVTGFTSTPSYNEVINPSASMMGDVLDVRGDRFALAVLDNDNLKIKSGLLIDVGSASEVTISLEDIFPNAVKNYPTNYTYNQNSAGQVLDIMGSPRSISLCSDGSVMVMGTIWIYSHGQGSLGQNENIDLNAMASPFVARISNGQLESFHQFYNSEATVYGNVTSFNSGYIVMDDSAICFEDQGNHYMRVSMVISYTTAPGSDPIYTYAISDFDSQGNVIKSVELPLMAVNRLVENTQTLQEAQGVGIYIDDSGNEPVRNLAYMTVAMSSGTPTVSLVTINDHLGVRLPFRYPVENGDPEDIFAFGEPVMSSTPNILNISGVINHANIGGSDSVLGTLDLTSYVGQIFETQVLHGPANMATFQFWNAQRYFMLLAEQASAAIGDMNDPVNYTPATYRSRLLGYDYQ
jgi:hypothetical protein